MSWTVLLPAGFFCSAVTGRTAASIRFLKDGRAIWRIRPNSSRALRIEGSHAASISPEAAIRRWRPLLLSGSIDQPAERAAGSGALGEGAATIADGEISKREGRLMQGVLRPAGR